MREIDTDKLPKNISFRGLKKIIQKTLPEDTPCPYCNVIMERNDPEHLAYISIDHVIPYSQCREHKLHNLMATCKYCNILKSDKDEFKTFVLPQPQKLRSKEIAAIHDILRHEWKIIILEEVRVLALLKDFTSIKYYKENIEFRTGSGEIHSFLNTIVSIYSKYHNKKFIQDVCNQYKIKKTSISPKELIEYLLDLKIQELTNKVNEAKKISHSIQYQEVQVNAIKKFIELRTA